MALELPYGYKNLDPAGSSNVDESYGYYNSLAEAYAAVPLAMRKGGRTVGIKQADGSIVEYWWGNDNDLSDEGLVKKPGSDSFDPTYLENEIQSLNEKKVNKEAGKGLSDENYTLSEKQKLADIEEGAQVNVIPDWNADTDNPRRIDNKPTKTSEFINDGATGVSPYVEMKDLLQNVTIVNILDFGAVGDGTTESAQFIQDALDFAKNGSVKRVYVPTGTYLISETLKIPSNIELFGDGKNLSIIKNSPTAAATLDVIEIVDAQGLTNNYRHMTMIATEGSAFADETTTENIRINNIGIDWNGVESGVYSILPILIGRSKNTIVDNVKIFDAYTLEAQKRGFSILFALSEDCEISNSWIGAADYESVAIRYNSLRTSVKRNIIDINKSLDASFQIHAIQIAFTNFMSEFGETVAKECFVEDNIILLKQNVNHAFTAHTAEGVYFRNNYVKFYDGNVAWGVKPFAATKNVEVTNNIFDARDGGMNDFVADADAPAYISQKLGFCAVSLNSGNIPGSTYDAVENVLISGNKVLIKNTVVATNPAPAKPAPIIGGYYSEGNNVVISDNIIEIDGYDNNNVPIIATFGDNVQVNGNVVKLKNPLEAQTLDGFIGFKTVGGNLVNASNNSFDGDLAYGLYIEDDGNNFSKVTLDKNITNNALKHFHSDIDEIFERGVQSERNSTEIHLNNLSGNVNNTPDWNATYTFNNLVPGGNSVDLIDTTGQVAFPVITGATLIAGSDFEPDAIFEMVVYTLNGTDVFYFFLFRNYISI